MKSAWFMLLAVTLVSMVALNLQAAPKEVTLKGEIMCAKCELKQGSKCQTVIRVKEDGKEVVYYFKDKGSKEEYHEAVCGGGVQEGTVTGTVTEKNGKKWITPSKVEYAKK